MASEAYLAALRKCDKEDQLIISNVALDLKDILLAMANHLAAIHPVDGLSEGGGAKSNAPIPQLDENIFWLQWTAWQNRFDRWAKACKLSDKAQDL